MGHRPQVATTQQTTRNHARRVDAPQTAFALSVRHFCVSRLIVNSLHIDGIDTTTYQTIFKMLRSKGFEQFPLQRVFYSELAWTAAEETAEHFTILLNAGEWKEGKRES